MRRLVASIAAATAIAGTAAMAWVPAAGASTATSQSGDLTVRSVDATAFPTVRVSVRVGGDATSFDPASMTLSENGRPVTDAHVLPVRQTSGQVGTALVLDTSSPMSSAGRFDAMKSAARAFVASRPAGELIEIVAAGAPARVVTGFTADRHELDTAIADLGATNGLALWDGITLASNNLGDRREVQPNIVVVAGGADKASDNSAGHAAAAASVAKALVFATAVQGAAPFSTSDLRQVATGTGGTFVEAQDAAAVSGSMQRLASDEDSQFDIEYRSAFDPKNPPPIDVVVRSGTATVDAVVAPGTVASGANVRPQVALPKDTPSFLEGSQGKLVATGTVVLAAVLFAVGLGIALTRERADLNAVLRPYTDEPGARSEDDDYGMVFAETGFVRRAVDTTAKLAADRGLLEKVEQKLEQAALPVRAAEALFFWLAAALIGAALCVVLWGPFGAAIAAFFLGFGPIALLNKLAARRKKAFTSLLPDTLQMFASTLRSGFSLLQGVEAVSQEVSDPMGSELRRVLVEARLGRQLEEALQDAADRMGSADFDWAVMAIRIQREVGGNLAELLDTVSQTMVQRERLRGEVKALTAEGRMSAIVLGALPFGLAGIMWALNPHYMGQLFTDGLGKIMVVGATSLAIAGFVWMKKMIEIEA